MKFISKIMIVLSLGFLIVGCQNRPTQYIDFSRPLEYVPLGDKDESEQGPILIALASVMSPYETIGYYRTIAEHISRAMGRKVILIQRKTYAEVNMLLANGDVDIAFLSTGAYSSYQGMNEIELLVMAEHLNNSFYTADVIVHKDSALYTMEDLRGKVFAFTDPLSYSGHMVINEYLKQDNIVPESFFKRYFYTYNHDKSLWAVANKLADAASLDSQIYEYAKAKNPELVENVRIITSIGPAPTGPVVISKKLRPEQKEQLRNVFLQMNHDPHTFEALQGLVIDRFVMPNPELYEPIRKLYYRASLLL